MNYKQYNELNRKVKKLENIVNKKEDETNFRSNTKKSGYACNRCNRKFTTFNELEVHAFYTHNLATCQVCLAQYNSHKVYRRLVGDGVFYCVKCENSF